MIVRRRRYEPRVTWLLAAIGVCVWQPTNAEDLELLLEKNVADKYLSEISYPHIETIDTSRSLRESGVEADIKIAEIGPGIPDLAELPELGANIEEQLAALLLDRDSQIYIASLGLPTKTFVDALVEKKAVAAAIASGESEKVRESIRQEISADKALEQKMLTAMRDWIRVDVDWVKVRIDTKPQSVVSSPIVLSNLSLGLKARLRGCVKISSWFCTRFQEIGFIHLQAAKLTIAMLPRPPALFGQPSFNNLDIVWSFKLLGKTYTIRVGITTLVNRQLGPFQLVDLSDFEVGIVGTNKKLKVEKIDTEAAADGLKVKVRLMVQQ
jgi:hypothetical protein